MSERTHQYMLDLGGLGGEPDPSWHEADHHDGGSPLGLHDTTLFDHPEAADGGLIDDYTGQPYQSTTPEDVSAGLRLLDTHFGGESFELVGYEDSLERELDEVEARVNNVELKRQSAFSPKRPKSGETAA